MPKSFTLSAAGLALCLAVSCAKIEVGNQNGGNPGQEETAEKISFSKVSTLSGSNDILAGASLGLTIGSPVSVSNVKLSVDAEGTITPEKDLYWGIGQTGTSSFTAYAPYNATFTDKAQADFILKTDQTPEGAVRESTLLTASTTARPSDAAVSLNFTHKVALLDILFANNSGKTIKDVYIVDVLYGISLDTQNGTCTTIQSQKSDIRMFNAGSKGGFPDFLAVIPPQKANLTLRVEFTDGTSRTCDLGKEKDIEAKQYSTSADPVILPSDSKEEVNFTLTVRDWEFGGDVIFGPDEGGGEDGDGTYTETFEGYKGGVKTDYSASESFTSTATGVTWVLTFGCIDQEADQASFSGGHCFTLGGKSGSADSGQSTLVATGFNGGITRLEFDYIANKEKTLAISVYSGANEVWSSGNINLTNNGTTKVLEHLAFDITGATSDVKVVFTNVSSARRISIGNLSWKNATGEGGNGGGSGEGEGEGGEEGGDSDKPHITMTATTVAAEYYGDYFDAGSQDWYIMMDNNSGESFWIECFSAAGTTTPEGTYVIDETESAAAGTAFPGVMDEEYYIYPTYYYNENNYNLCLAASGTIKITRSGSNYTIQADIEDEELSVSCSYSGPITITKGEIEEAAYANSAGTKASLARTRTHHRMTLRKVTL